jgi:hypothetical protein
MSSDSEFGSIICYTDGIKRSKLTREEYIECRLLFRSIIINSDYEPRRAFSDLQEALHNGNAIHTYNIRKIKTLRREIRSLKKEIEQLKNQVDRSNENETDHDVDADDVDECKFTTL